MRVYVASATMTTGTPATTAARNGARDESFRVVTVSTTPATLSVLPRTRPSPGKRFAVVATPAPVIPRMNAVPWLAAVAGIDTVGTLRNATPIVTV